MRKLQSATAELAQKMKIATTYHQIVTPFHAGSIRG
jgi:hypothetical protein